MRKLIICITLMFFAAAAFSDDTETYIQIYNTALTNIEQYDLLKMMTDEGMPGMEDFYVYALRRLISNYSNIKEAPQLEAADNQALLLAREVAKGSGTPAIASDLWVIVEKFYNEYTRGEAMIALAKLKAGEYLPKIILFLNELNAHRTDDRIYGERLANGAIIALETYGEPSCYIPVYFASKGWYSDPVKIQAQKSMEVISSEPMPFMLEILRGSSYTTTQKYEVLQHVVTGNNFSGTQKSDMAAVALSEAFRIPPSGSGERMILYQMRKLSLNTIRENGINDNSVYNLIQRCYTSAVDISEKDDVINVLATLATDEAVRILSVALMEMNNKLSSGRLTQDDRRVTTPMLIDAIGRTGNRNGRAALLGVINSNWENYIKNLARDALKKLV